MTQETQAGGHNTTVVNVSAGLLRGAIRDEIRQQLPAVPEADARSFSLEFPAWVGISGLTFLAQQAWCFYAHSPAVAGSAVSRGFFPCPLSAVSSTAQGIGHMIGAAFGLVLFALARPNTEGLRVVLKGMLALLVVEAVVLLVLNSGIR